MKSGIGQARVSYLAGLGRKRAVMVAATGVAAVAAVTASALPAGASPAAAVTGTEHFQVVSASVTSTKSPLIAWGVFTAAGTDRQNANNTDTFFFSGGAFLVKHATTKGTPRETFNKKTCLLTYSEKGTIKLGSGTGKYKGISGSGTYVLSDIAIAPKTKSGACNPNANPVASQSVITAVGKVKLP